MSSSGVTSSSAEGSPVSWPYRAVYKTTRFFAGKWGSASLVTNNSLVGRLQRGHPLFVYWVRVPTRTTGSLCVHNFLWEKGQPGQLIPTVIIITAKFTLNPCQTLESVRTSVFHRPTHRRETTNNHKITLTFGDSLHSSIHE